MTNNLIDKILLFLLLPFSLIVFYGIYKLYINNSDNNIYYIIYLIISLLNIIIIFYLFFFSNFLKILYLLTITLFILFSYSIEFYLIYKPITIWEEYERITDKGIKIIPHSRKRLFKYLVQKIKFIHWEEFLMGLVLTNENGFYPLVYHDKYGWNNPNEIYENFDAVMLGDSFVEGYSVNQRSIFHLYLVS